MNTQEIYNVDALRAKLTAHLEDTVKFKELQIGQTFDFIGPDRTLTSFYSTCEKISARQYRWKNPIQCSLSPNEYLVTRVGTVNVDIYHVDENIL